MARRRYRAVRERDRKGPTGGFCPASVVGRIATGRRAGQRVLRVDDCIDADDLPALEGERCASVGGVSLQANVAVPARDRRRLERLCRNQARPPVPTSPRRHLTSRRPAFGGWPGPISCGACSLSMCSSVHAVAGACGCSLRSSRRHPGDPRLPRSAHPGPTRGPAVSDPGVPGIGQHQDPVRVQPAERLDPRVVLAQLTTPR
jgi:hypothetical protein